MCSFELACFAFCVSGIREGEGRRGNDLPHMVPQPQKQLLSAGGPLVVLAVINNTVGSNNKSLMTRLHLDLSPTTRVAMTEEHRKAAKLLSTVCVASGLFMRSNGCLVVVC